MEEKRWFAIVACSKAKTLQASAVKNQYIFAAILVMAAGAAVQFSGVELFRPAFAEQSPVAALPDASSIQQAPSGNSYYRSISESMSVVASHGSGSSSPQSYFRSMSESMSITTVQGKAPNLYTRSMSEQVSLTTGMPSSSAPGTAQTYRASPSSYSASSGQRIDERISFRNTSGVKADLVLGSSSAGTPAYSTDSVIINTEISSSGAGMIIQHAASIDAESEDAAADNSTLLRQLDAFNDYMLMQKSIENTTLANLSTSAIILLGTASIFVARQPAFSSGRLQKRMYALFLLKTIHDKNANARKTGNTQVTYILLVVLVIFTVSSIVKAVDPLAGQAFAAITFAGQGASSFTNGAAPTPALPNNLQDGDLMIAYFYSKEIVDGTVSISSGWTPLYNERSAGGLLAVWYRIYQTGDSAPTFTLGGHVANNSFGDTAGAQIAAWRGVDTAAPIAATGTIDTNLAQQNIGPISGVTLNAGETVIVLGGKRDDWTSVATLSGDSLTWGEIGEPDSTSGSDAGLVWDYAIAGGSGTIVTAKTFTVTGGAVATGKGVMLSLNLPPQNFQGNPSDTLGLTDTIAAKITRRAVTDNMAMSETVARTQNVVKSKTEQMVLVDSLRTSSIKTVSEGLAMTESISIGLSKSFTDQLGIAESITKGASIPLSESFSVTESITTAIVASRGVTEQLGATDILQQSIVTTRTVFEQFGLAETTSKVVSRTMTEQMTLSDTIAKMMPRSLSEQLAIEESTVRTTVLNRTLLEQLAVEESVSKSFVTMLFEQLTLTEQADRNIVLTRPISEQLVLAETITKRNSMMLSESLGMVESVGRTIFVSRSAAEQLMVLTDEVSSSMIFTKAITDSLVMTDTSSGAPIVFIMITDSMAIYDQFTDISAVFSLDLGEPLVLAQSFATNFAGFFSQPGSEGIIISDNVALSLDSGGSFDANASDSMGMRDSLTIMIMHLPPPPPVTIDDMPELMITETEDINEIEGLIDPIEASEIDGQWEVQNLDEEGLESLLEITEMPIYDIGIEASSDGIDDLTLVMPTFWVSMGGDWSDDAGFLTATLSELPAGMEVVVPINVQASMDGDEDFDMLGNMTVSFIPAQNAGNFTMLITILGNSPEDTAASLPGDIPAFYIDVAIAADFPGIMPDNGAFYEELPIITFTLAEEWAVERGIERDMNNVPIISLFLLDESDSSWIDLTGGIVSPTSAVENVYPYSATLPHFSTFVVTANTVSGADDSSKGGRRGQEYTRLMVESMFVSAAANLGVPMESGGKIVIKDITDSFTLRAIQPQALHQRVITIQNVSVAVSVADVRPSGMFGTAVATVNFEITNKNSVEEELVLRYWYSDSSSAAMLYEGEQAVTVGAGQSLFQQVEIPFYSEGLFDLMIGAESDDGTIVTTDIVVSVPWLAVYLYLVIVMALAAVLISLGYVIFAMRRPPRSPYDKDAR